MPNKQASKSGIPFILFIIVITILVGIWFLSKEDKIADEIDETVNQSVNQAQKTSNSNSDANDEADDIVVFQNAEYNFTLNLLENESVKEENSAEIYTVYFNSDKLSIMDEDMEIAVRDAISVQSEQAVKVGGVTGEEIVATSTKDGSQTQLILLKKDGKLFQFQGTADFLTKIKAEFFFES